MARGNWTEETKKTHNAYDAIDVYVKALEDGETIAANTRPANMIEADALQADLDAGIVRYNAPRFVETGKVYPDVYPADHKRAGQPRQNAGKPIMARAYVYADVYPDVYPDGHDRAGEVHGKAGKPHPKAGETCRPDAIGAKADSEEKTRDMRPSERLQAKMKIRSLRSAKPKTNTFKAKRDAVIDGVAWLRESMGDDMPIRDFLDAGLDADVLIAAGYDADKVAAFAALGDVDA